MYESRVLIFSCGGFKTIFKNFLSLIYFDLCMFQILLLHRDKKIIFAFPSFGTNRFRINFL